MTDERLIIPSDAWEFDGPPSGYFVKVTTEDGRRVIHVWGRSLAICRSIQGHVAERLAITEDTPREVLYSLGD